MALAIISEANSILQGVLPLYKEAGHSSGFYVNQIKRLLHIKKVGHTGTLDPAAEGVLPICLNRATKIVPYLMEGRKAYRCFCRFGIRTDTEDTTGEVLSRADTEDLNKLSDSEIREAILSFEGGYSQLPPMYSAKKVQGRRLYEFAREGQAVERRSVNVQIYGIGIDETGRDGEGPYAIFNVECGKGTYIRSLCRDIGEKLKVGAAMEGLVRTLSGGFRLEEAIRLSDLEGLYQKGKIGDAIKPIEAFFMELPLITVSGQDERKVRNGNVLRTDKAEGRYRVRLSDGTFAAVYEVRGGEAALCTYFLT
ncbi:MAG: tRNA pseudouridine(55) synthase TruB [Lachnospiraceae bacterium]|nr:tRNA pseudouridine(55) synthase TruB [Lachnospiraceae bacterium]